MGVKKCRVKAMQDKKIVSYHMSFLIPEFRYFYLS